EAASEGSPLILVVAGQLERLAVEHDGAVLRPALLSLLGGGDEVLDSTSRISRVTPVPRECGAGLADLGGGVLEEPRELLVPILPLGTRQQVVRDVPDQDMGERELLVALDRRDGLPPD